MTDGITGGCNKRAADEHARALTDLLRTDGAGSAEGLERSMATCIECARLHVACAGFYTTTSDNVFMDFVGYPVPDWHLGKSHVRRAFEAYVASGMIDFTAPVSEYTRKASKILGRPSRDTMFPLEVALRFENAPLVDVMVQLGADLPAAAGQANSNQELFEAIRDISPNSNLPLLVATVTAARMRRAAGREQHSTRSPSKMGARAL